jgi:hypothetical protein
MEAETMPNKTIYVADGDLPVFERAQELAGENLSATIVQALRRFVATEDARAQGYAEVSLKVGSQRIYTNKRFLARELARGRALDREHNRIVTQIVFQTTKGRLVLYTSRSPDWTAWTTYWDRDWDVDVDVDVDSEHAARHRQRWERRRQDKGHRGDWGNWGNWAAGQDWSAWSEGSERRMDVYETLDELKPHIGDELYNAVAQALRGEEDEFLDI